MLKKLKFTDQTLDYFLDWNSCDYFFDDISKDQVKILKLKHGINEKNEICTSWK
jgi:hypothetical protein